MEEEADTSILDEVLASPPLGDERPPAAEPAAAPMDQEVAASAALCLEQAAEEAAAPDAKKQRLLQGSANGGPLGGEPLSGVGALRQAMATSDAEDVLCEIRHFLGHDQRLPERTRLAVQFLDGLRQEMIVAKKDETSPEFFRDPFEASDIQQYTFREVREKLGDGFRDKFWPMFQMYNRLPTTAGRPTRVQAAHRLPPRSQLHSRPRAGGGGAGRAAHFPGQEPLKRNMRAEMRAPSPNRDLRISYTPYTRWPPWLGSSRHVS
jgi:hypothetical protein